MLKIDSEAIENKIKKYYSSNFDLLVLYSFVLVAFLIGMFIRISLLPQISVDMSGFLTSWYKDIQSHGGFAAIGRKIGNFPPMYYYFMAIMTYSKLPIHIAIKWISIVFDIILAFYVMKILELKDTKKSIFPAIAFAVVFCLPTVVINSAAWGHSDAIYTTFLVMCLYYLLNGKDRCAMIMLGLSFAFKVQAVFIMPVVLIMVLLKKIRLKTLIWIPATYFITLIPAALSGGNILKLISVCFSQFDTQGQLTVGMPNMWALLETIKSSELGRAGFFFVCVVALIMVFYYYSQKKFKITTKSIIGLTTISAFILPYTMPYMNPRSMYFTEIMFVLFVFCYRKNIWLIATTQFCSAQCVLWDLCKHGPIDLRLLALLWIVNATVAFYTLREEINSPTDTEEICMSFEKQKSVIPMND
ncbi:MAG: DUF2029 domain-containing protein [Spirochaetales bacterium]|nr:DUF2029 domain-containing protein [Spirochaetales bacterium]